MRKHSYLLTVAVMFLIPLLGDAQVTRNLQIIWAKRTSWQPSQQPFAWGYGLVPLGDLNGDGYGDILIQVMTSNCPPNGRDPGWVEIFHGGSPMDTVPDVILRGEWYGDGYALSATTGDFNGDGISDIVVGAPSGARLPDTTNRPGKVYIYYGRRPMRTTPDLIIYGEEHAIQFSFKSVAATDVNGDEYDDLAVGAYCWRWRSGEEYTGRVYIYYGSSSGLSPAPNVILTGIIGSMEMFGSSVGGGKDVNLDSDQDLIVGAGENSEAYPLAGKVYIFDGGNPMNTQPIAWIHGEGGGQNLGWFETWLLNSFTGRPYADALTSTPFYRNNPYQGKVYLLYGGSPMDTLVDYWLVGAWDTSSSIGLGYSNSPGGDVTGMGLASILASNPGENNSRGGCYLWLGGISPDTVSDASIHGRYQTDDLGVVVSSAGDVDRDGKDEFMLSNYTGIPVESLTVWICKYTGTGMEEETESKRRKVEESLKVLPNPFISFATIPGHENEQFVLYDITGRQAGTYRGDRIGDKIGPGVYFVRPLAGKGKPQRIVKIR